MEVRCPICKGLDIKYVEYLSKGVAAVYCYKCDSINLKFKEESDD